MLLKSAFQNKIFINLIFYFCLIVSFFAFLFSFYINEQKLNIPLFNGDNADIRINMQSKNAKIFINDIELNKTNNFKNNKYDFYELNNYPVYKISFLNGFEKAVVSIGGELFYFTNADIKNFKKDKNGRYLFPDYVKYNKNSKYITDRGIIKKFFTFFLSIFYNSKFYIIPLFFLFLSVITYVHNKDKINLGFSFLKKSPIIWILILALILRLSDLSHFYWTDELYSLYEAGNINSPFMKTFSDPGNPPLFFIFVRFFSFMFGFEPCYIRLLPVCFSLFSIYFIYLFLKENLEIENKNLIINIVCFLYSINIYSICSAQELRSYSLCILFSIIFSYLIFKIIKYKKTKDFILYLIFSILAFNLHYFEILVLISNFISGMVFLDNKNRIKFFIIHFIAFLSFLPYFLLTALNNALLDKEFNKFLMPDIKFYIDVFIKFIQGETAFFIVLILFILSFILFLRKKIFIDNKSFFNIYYYCFYMIFSLFIFSYLFSLIKPIARTYYFVILLPYFVILAVFSIFIIRKKVLAYFLSILIIFSYFSYSNYINRDKSRLLDFKRLVKFYYCDSKQDNKGALIVPHSKNMIIKAFPSYLNKNDEIIVIPPPLNIEKLINEIENSKNTGFYLKLEYNILNEFLKTVADRYDWEIIRTDKDVLIAKIIKRK